MCTDSQITEDDIVRLTKLFYSWVRKDDQLGPIFNAKIGTSDAQWHPHIANINDFWSSIFLKTKRFTGNPMIKHTTLPGISPAHFARWLDLFAKAGEKTLPPQKQAQFKMMAERIAKSLQMGLAFHFNGREETADDNPFKDFGLSRPSWQETGAPNKTS